MDNNSLRIVYMGTPGFAVPPLEKLVEAGFNVIAVITAPDRPAGRGKKIRYSAVKQATLDLNLKLLADEKIPILQPANLKDPGFAEQLRTLKPDLQIVVAFRMLPEIVWRIPRTGTFNLHASLLPQYRGAAPINHAIINGETETGVTTFMIDENIDTGNILLQEKTTIGDHDTAGELHDRLMILGADLVLETVNRLISDNLKPQSQDNLVPAMADLKKAPKIFKSHCRISWAHPGLKVYNMIRGLSPYPAAFTFLEKSGTKRILCKIYTSTFEILEHNESPGTVLSDGKSFLKVAVGDGYLRIHSIQQEGRRRMDVKDFLAGISSFSELRRFF